MTHLVAMTSNAPPDVDPVVVAGSGRQVLQVLASAGDSTARPGSCRKPPGALYVESGGGVGTLLSLSRPLWTDNLLAKRRAAYVSTVGPGESPMGLRMQPRNEGFFTLPTW